MYYSSFGILAVIHHIIINYDALKNWKNEPKDGAHFRYRQFLNALLVFYVADLLWGFLEESGIRVLAYADTVVFFVMMALSVLLWTRYVVSFLDRSGMRSKSLLGAGWAIFAFVMLSLSVNFFYPFIFTFTQDMEYVPGAGRYILLAAQLIMFVLVSVYSLFVALKSERREKVHYGAVCLSSAVMTVFIILQSFDAFAPFYTIGCFFANCLIHVFVEEDEKVERDRITAAARKDRERYGQIATSLASDYEAIFYINIETGKYLKVSAGNAEETVKVPDGGEDFYREVRNNVDAFVHPDDREFAESMYYKATMQRNLEGRNSYSFKYRIMVGDEARFYRFVVMLSEDGEHFVLCARDIQDTITAETALREKQKASVTFSQIAESLASNYDVIYYVDMETGDYVGYTSHNKHGKLKVDESGDDFFEMVKRNISLIIHPKDRERVFAAMDKDYLFTTLEDRKQFNIQYRLFINEKVKHTRLSVRKSSDGEHLIVGIENIDDEVKREREHIHALNTEKELARRDELTGTRNKTAFTEFEQSIQDELERGMDYLPFAVAVCDLNNLKRINDTEGHKAGDEYIKASAKLICDVFDHSPVFRIGGDEFVVFVSGEDYEARKQLTERIHSISVSNRDRHEGPVIAIGIADYEPSGDMGFTGIFERADRLMYEDKRVLKENAD